MKNVVVAKFELWLRRPICRTMHLHKSRSVFVRDDWLTDVGRCGTVDDCHGGFWGIDQGDGLEATFGT